jgi:hypothetical protein
MPTLFSARIRRYFQLLVPAAPGDDSATTWGLEPASGKKDRIERTPVSSLLRSLLEAPPNFGRRH